jgi:hypothetical protein
MNHIHRALFIAALGLAAAVRAPAADSAGSAMHKGGAGTGHPMSPAASGSHAIYAAGPALRSASAAVARRSSNATKSPAITRDTLPTSKFPYLYADPKTQLQIWGDHYGICVGGPYDLGKDCTRSVKAVTTDGLFDTTG